MVRMLLLLAFVLVVAASFVYMHKQMTKYKSLRYRKAFSPVKKHRVCSLSEFFFNLFFY